MLQIAGISLGSVIVFVSSLFSISQFSQPRDASLVHVRKVFVPNRTGSSAGKKKKTSTGTGKDSGFRSETLQKVPA